MNPYKVLGVPEGADETTIKKAYHELVKKYHPDKYANNPLSDLAEEKLKQINEAYDMLINKKGSGGYSSGGSSYSTSYSGSSYSAQYTDVRSLLNQGRVDEAYNILQTKDQNCGEYHYLMGVISLRKGLYNQGINHLNLAVNMEPGNSEYRAARDNIMNRNAQYRKVTMNQTGCSSCDICSSLFCADCCCECMGGDLISCC